MGAALVTLTVCTTLNSMIYTYLTRTVDKVDLSCNDEIMKIVDNDAYCGSLINSTGPFADCLAKMVRNTFAKSQQKPNSSALCVSLCPTGRK